MSMAGTLALVPGSVAVTPGDSTFASVRVPGAEVVGEAATVKDGILQPPAELRGACNTPSRGPTLSCASFRPHVHRY